MKLSTYRNALAIVLLFLAASSFAQMQMGHFNPDSLKTVTVTGKIIIDSTTSQFSKYYLDSAGTGTKAYILDFGPAWYQPDSTTAKLPTSGQQVTIVGGEPQKVLVNNLKIIIVYEINGAFWRDPFDAVWNNLGRYSHMGDHMKDSCMGNAFGFKHDSLKSVTLKGKILVDTTFINTLTYLDTSKVDTSKTRKPDFFLNLGPYWYQPTTPGVTRPKNGDTVTITGGLLANTPLKMVIVYTINGKLWRDSTTIGKTIGGGWAHKNMNKSAKFYSPFDTSTWISMNPNWQGGMGGGKMMPDSLFAQILEVTPGSIPNRGNQKILAGYELGFFSNDGKNATRQNASCGGRLKFNSPVKMQLHFTPTQITGGNFNKNTIKVMYWNDSTKTWDSVSNAQVNPTTNTVTFSQNIASSYVIVTATQTAVGVEEYVSFTPASYKLEQNYPNPFNPTTYIIYEIPKSGLVTLKIYNILGQQVAQLINEIQNPGKYTVSFNAGNLASGIYIYQLSVNEFQQTKKMIMLK